MNKIEQAPIMDVSASEIELKRIADEFYKIKFSPDKLLLVEDFPDHQKYLHIVGIIHLCDCPAIYVSFSKAYTIQLQDDSDSGFIKKRKKGEIDEALAIRVFTTATQPTNSEDQYIIISNRQNRVGSFYFEKSPEGWCLIHRVIIPEYRKQTIGTQILKFAEGIIQEIANISGEPQSILISAGQKSVIEFAAKNGYKPQSESDKTSLSRITSGSFEQKIAELHINGEWRPQQDSDPYLFERLNTHQAIKDAIRIKLVKVLQVQKIP